MINVRLAVKNLSKSYSVPVLAGVNLSIAGGEVHAIVGENGAGKTTLVNILAGLVRKDGGDMFLDGNQYVPSGPREAFDNGISFVAQELSVVNTLNAAENIGFRALPQRMSVILRNELYAWAKPLLDSVGLSHVSPDTLAGELSLGERQLLELAKALSTDCRLLLLDEPTSALSAEQADRLHEIVAGLATKGTSVIYISHRLQDVLRISDAVTILKDGKVVSSAAAGELSEEFMLQQMASRETGVHSHRKYLQPQGTTVLSVMGIATMDLQGPVSFECQKGEILGIAGLAGSGRSELLEALFGLVPLKSGSVSRILGDRLCKICNAGQAIDLGMGFLGEDRRSMGLISGQSVLSNITLPGLPGFASRIGVVDQDRERAAANKVARELDIRCASLDQDIDQLSGGNQQKALIARWILCDADLLLLDEPTRGIDVATKSAIYDLLYELRGKGKSIVMSSSEIEELMAVCDRILVLSDRKQIHIFNRDNWSEAEILAAAFAGFSSVLSSHVSANGLAPDSVELHQ